MGTLKPQSNGSVIKAIKWQTLRLVLIARLAEENYKSVYRKNYTLTFQSA